MQIIVTLYIALVIAVGGFLLVSLVRNPRGDVESKQDRVRGLGGLLLVLLSAGAFGWGGSMIVSNQNMKLRTIPIEGRVVRLEGGSKIGTKAPVVRYQVDGKSYEVQGKVFSSPPSYSVGDTVVVRYWRGRPAEGHLDSIAELWFPPLALMGLGIVLGCLAAGAFLGPNWLDHTGQ